MGHGVIQSGVDLTTEHTESTEEEMYRQILPLSPLVSSVVY